MDVWINGEFVEDTNARVSVFDAGLQHGVGLFETMAARNGSVFRLNAHIERLVTSAASLRLSERLQPEPLAQAVVKALAHSERTEARIRLTLTGGDLNAMRHTGQGPSDPTIFIVVQPRTEYPETFFSEGITAVLAPGRLNPWEWTSGHKTLNYWPRISALQMAAGMGAGEALWLTPDALVASGSVSNLFLIKGGQLITPAAQGSQDINEIAPPVLPGITRQAVIELATASGMEIIHNMPTLDDVADADECFLTNSSWHVLPMTSLAVAVRGQADEEPHLEQRPIGDGTVGGQTADLRAAMLELIERETGQVAAQ